MPAAAVYGLHSPPCLARNNVPKVWLMHEWLDRGRA
jgi:hypothetical protein